jgi:thiol reductant ABC exporter CydC subunit
VFRYLERYVSHQVTFRLLTRLRLWFYRRLEPLAPAALVAYSGGDLLSRAIRDVASLENFYVRSLAPPLAALVSVMAMGGFFAAHGLELALSLLLFLALTGALLPVLILNLSRDAGERIPVLYASLNSAFVDGIQGLADLMVFGGGQAMKNRIAGIAQELKTVKYRWATINGLHLALSGFLAHMGMWTVLVMGIPMLMDGRMDGVLLTVLALAALASFEAVAPLPGAAQHMRENLEAGERLFEILEHKPEVLPPEESLPFPEQFDLSIRNVSFHYPHQDQRGNNSTTEGWDTKCVLDEISFELPQGARYALVGASGSGKSTLINLLLRLWDFEKGEIYLGGIDLACFDPDLMRKRLGVVPQNPHLFNGTVRDNLLVARPEAPEWALQEAARVAGLDGFVRDLPEGYETWIGEAGARMSAGERQRVAIARALLKDSPLLILDEPTANLDALTEKQVLESIFNWIGYRSLLMATHRLVGLDGVHQILVLKQGRIAERGSHDELLKAGGIYTRMWELQTHLLV